MGVFDSSARSGLRQRLESSEVCVCGLGEGEGGGGRGRGGCGLDCPTAKLRLLPGLDFDNFTARHCKKKIYILLIGRNDARICMAICRQ